jgi:hypothetical protein
MMSDHDACPAWHGATEHGIEDDHDDIKTLSTMTLTIKLRTR